MDLRERTLYHQIHPLKLAVDWGAGIVALLPFWRHQLLVALLIAFMPSILVSFLLIRFADLEKYKLSRFGRYVKRYMTRSAEAVRFAGYALMAVGAWSHAAWLIIIGLFIILMAWLRGVIFPNNAQPPT